MCPARKTSDSRLIVGGHVKGGPTGAVRHALEIGAQAMQIFIGSPQSWKEPTPAPADIAQCKADIEKHELGPLFVHGNYLVNLASPSDDNWAKSVDNLSRALRLSDKLGAIGLIFHPGSARDLSYAVAMNRVISALTNVLAGYKGDCKLLLEVCAGQGQTIGAKFSQFGEILSALNHDQRLAVCWDTCHLFNAGYDVSSKDGLSRTVEEFEETVGFSRLLAIHANDSKTPLGARRDRHENIGEGHIGAAGFKRMVNHPLLRPLPWILEVPGFEGKGPDRKNIEILRRLAGEKR
jgi:deoxyribonuclease-4